MPSGLLKVFFFLLCPRRCNCTRQPLVYGCSPHSPALCHAWCFLKRRMQLFTIVSSRVDPSFLLSSPFPGSMNVAVVCYLGVSLVLHSIHVSKVSQSLAPYSVYYSSSDSLLNISSFLFLSLLVAPSIFRRHAISNTRSLCFCLSRSPRLRII